MFEEFLEQGKKRWEKLTRDILVDLENQYEKFWHELIEDLTKKKLGLEETIKKLEKVKGTRNEEINRLSGELIQLNESVKLNRDKMKKYEAKQDEMVAKITDIETRENESVAKQEEVFKKEQAIEKREEELKIEMGVLEERQRTIKKAWDRVHGG